MKGTLDGSVSKIASVVSDFVEEQKHKDLLDVSGFFHRIDMYLQI